MYERNDLLMARASPKKKSVEQGTGRLEENLSVLSEWQHTSSNTFTSALFSEICVVCFVCNSCLVLKTGRYLHLDLHTFTELTPWDLESANSCRTSFSLHRRSLKITV